MPALHCTEVVLTLHHSSGWPLEYSSQKNDSCTARHCTALHCTAQILLCLIANLSEDIYFQLLCEESSSRHLTNIMEVQWLHRWLGVHQHLTITKIYIEVYPF